MRKHLLFDLDGTLIDSAESILNSFAQAFATTQTPLQVPLSHAVIGPPLMHTLARLSASDDPVLLARLADAFKQGYDQQGYLHTQVYTGVPALLAQLQQQGFDCYIVTNKRLTPTQKIVQHLVWQRYFKGVYALDCVQPAFANKAALIAHVVATHHLAIEDCLYIGDRIEDGDAADANHMAFTLVSWGYAEALSDCRPHWGRCASVAALAQHVNQPCATHSVG